MKVVVPIDNTLASQPVVDAVMSTRWFEGTEIVLITVVSDCTVGAQEGSPPPDCVRDTENLAVELRNALAQCEVSFFVREGDPKTEIVSFAKEVGAHMIIAPSPKESTLPSVVECLAGAIIGHAHCPVFVAKECHERPVDPQAGYSSVLVPVDDSIYAELALQWLLNFKWSAPTKFLLCSVIENESARGVAEESLQTKARALAVLLQTHSVATAVRTGDPYLGIAGLAQENGTDLIVIGSHGRHGIHKIMLGSVSEHLAHKGPCSVVIVRGIAEADEHWHRTGVFRRPKFDTLENLANDRPSPSDGGNQSPHIMPGGMH